MFYNRTHCFSSIACSFCPKIWAIFPLYILTMERTSQMLCQRILHSNKQFVLQQNCLLLLSFIMVREMRLHREGTKMSQLLTNLHYFLRIYLKLLNERKLIPFTPQATALFSGWWWASLVAKMKIPQSNPFLSSNLRNVQ